MAETATQIQTTEKNTAVEVLPGKDGSNMVFVKAPNSDNKWTRGIGIVATQRNGEPLVIVGSAVVQNGEIQMKKGEAEFTTEHVRRLLAELSTATGTAERLAEGERARVAQEEAAKQAAATAVPTGNNPLSGDLMAQISTILTQSVQQALAPLTQRLDRLEWKNTSAPVTTAPAAPAPVAASAPAPAPSAPATPAQPPVAQSPAHGTAPQSAAPQSAPAPSGKPEKYANLTDEQWGILSGNPKAQELFDQLIEAQYTATEALEYVTSAEKQ